MQTPLGDCAKLFYCFANLAGGNSLRVHDLVESLERVVFPGKIDIVLDILPCKMPGKIYIGKYIYQLTDCLLRYRLAQRLQLPDCILPEGLRAHDPALAERRYKQLANLTNNMVEPNHFAIEPVCVNQVRCAQVCRGEVSFAVL